MSSLTAVLDFQGDLEQGFKISVMIGLENSRPHISDKGSLPANQELTKWHVTWREAYNRYYTSSSLRAIKLTSASRNINRANLRQQCVDAADKLVGELNSWLTSNTFWPIYQSLLSTLTEQGTTRIILCADDERLWQLPWHEWSLFKAFPQAMISFSQWAYNQTTAIEVKPPSKQVKVLACLADDADIDTQPDKEYLSETLNATVLEQCDRIHMGLHLWDEPWDVMVFSGHSRTEGEKGRVFIGSDDPDGDSLTLDELQRTLKKSVSQGLKLVVFNSCQGVGLARQLQGLNVPHIVVMREPIPDGVAHKFLEYFFDAFKAGDSLDAAIEVARGQLEKLHYEFPCASWLPVVWQSPATKTLTWKSLEGIKQPSPISTLPIWRRALTLCGVVLIITTSMLGVRHFGLLQPWELSAYDRMMRLRPEAHGADEQVIVIGIDDKDIQYQKQSGIESSSSISDQALLELLKKINPHNPSTIGFDIQHNFPFEDTLSRYLESYENLVVMCRHEVSNTKLASVAAPDNFARYSSNGDTQIGFTNIPQDGDFVLRRQAIAQASGRECKADSPNMRDLSFNLVIALKHLNHLKASMVTNERNQQEFKIEEVVLPRMLNNFGGYNLPKKELANYQLMLNYRKAPVRVITLRSILDGSSDADLDNLFANKVVLIGRDDGKEDLHLTPYSHSAYPPEKQAGVKIQAQMINQLISYISYDGQLANPTRRPLIRSWTEWQEYLWIGFWVMIGSRLAYLVDSFWARILSVTAVLVALYSVCLVLFSNSWWVPVIAPLVGFLIAFLVVSVTQPKIFSKNSGS
ncbi:MAG: CHASE2 domain-containing protein [Cyanobacteria bacterium P01_B01_bin.77]